jgi:hypothetical protein
MRVPLTFFTHNCHGEGFACCRYHLLWQHAERSANSPPRPQAPHAPRASTLSTCVCLTRCQACSLRIAAAGQRLACGQMQDEGWAEGTWGRSAGCSLLQQLCKRALARLSPQALVRAPSHTHTVTRGHRPQNGIKAPPKQAHGPTTDWGLQVQKAFLAVF